MCTGAMAPSLEMLPPLLGLCLDALPLACSLSALGTDMPWLLMPVHSQHLGQIRQAYSMLLTVPA